MADPSRGVKGRCTGGSRPDFALGGALVWSLAGVGTGGPEGPEVVGAGMPTGFGGGGPLGPLAFAVEDLSASSSEAPKRVSNSSPISESRSVVRRLLGGGVRETDPLVLREPDMEGCSNYNSVVSKDGSNAC